MSTRNNSPFNSILSDALRQHSTVFIAHGEESALLRALPPLHTGVQGMLVLGYATEDGLTDLRLAGAASGQGSAVIRDAMPDIDRRAVAQSIREGRVNVLCAPWKRFAEAAFVRFLHATPVCCTAIYSKGVPGPEVLALMRAILEVHRSLEPVSPFVWACAQEFDARLEDTARNMGFNACLDLRRRDSATDPMTRFHQRMEKLESPRLIASDMGLSDEDAIQYIEEFVRARGIHNPLPWAGAEVYLHISTVAASAANYTLPFIQRICNAEMDRLSVAVVLACLRVRQANRPGESVSP